MSAQPNPVIEVPATFTRHEERNVPSITPVPAATPMHMLAVAVQRGMDAATIKDLMDLQERWERLEGLRAYNEAFAAFKAEAVNVLRTKKVDAGPLAGKSYAELHTVVDAVTPALSKHGLSASWKVTKDEKDWIEVTCYLKHVKGHAESVSLGGPPDAGGAKSAIQARASTISYLERYTLKAACGVAEKNDDNDGRGSSTEMTTKEMEEWVKKIKAATTKAAAKAICAEAIEAANALNDLSAYRTFKETLKEQNEFIDGAAK